MHRAVTRVTHLKDFTRVYGHENLEVYNRLGVAMASASAILKYARKGPLFCRLGSASPPAAEWKSHGEALTEQLLSTSNSDNQDPPLSLSGADTIKHTSITSRIYHLYLPVYFWCREIVRKSRADVPDCAVGIGLSAVQGCGKTTLVNFLTDRFMADGLICAAVSFDDFYLTGADQDALAAAHPDNPLLQVRGNAGTHDLKLGEKILTKLISREEGVVVPRYDKSARNGRGDRAPREDWTKLEQKADVVLLEGWMAGFEPVAISRQLSECKSLETPNFETGIADINRILQGYRSWHDIMSAWIVVSIDDYNHVYRWRLEAEHAMAAKGKPGMTDEQLRDFVSRYMPAYRTYLPGLYESAGATGSGVGGRETLLVHVDGNRQVVGKISSE